MPNYAAQSDFEMDVGFESDIRIFKSRLCNETDLITDALRRDFSDFALSPILDVGAGFQAISLNAFPGADVTLLDLIDYGSGAPGENRVSEDFFKYRPVQSRDPQTLLFCHVLQYLDEDVKALYRKIDALAPRHIITVVNDNDLEFGEVVRWAKENLRGANPEENVPMWPLGYRMVRRAKLSAMLSCPDYETLAYHFGRLILDLPQVQSRSKQLLAKLRSSLSKPEIIINQSIFGYEI